jgi:hypothetical protein
MSGVVQALTAVMAEMPAIGKADKSPEGYSYRGIEAITKHLQPLLAKHGVIFAPSATITEVRPSPAMKDGWQDVYMQVDWKVYGPDGSCIEARTNGVGRDRSDKGANKAQTQALKYLLLQLLCIADKADDADGLTYEHERIERPPAPVYSAETVQAMDDVKALAGTDLAPAIKSWANGRKLTLDAFEADHAWRGEVCNWLDEAKQTAGADSPQGTP